MFRHGRGKQRSDPSAQTDRAQRSATAADVSGTPTSNASASTAGEESGTRLLERLIGEQLSSVIFVMDYVQLDFNGPRLSCFSWPTLSNGSQPAPTQFGDAGYRDQLCTLIAKDLIAVDTPSQAGIRLHFTDSRLGPAGSLILDPGPEELNGPEVAMLDGFTDRQWMVWRPGDPPFEHL